MKRKNISKPKIDEKEKSFHKQRIEPDNQKKFNVSDLCKSDSEESLDDTKTNYSVINSNKNILHSVADLSDFPTNKKKKINLEASPNINKGFYSDQDKIDLKKKLHDFKIIDIDSDNNDQLKILKKVKQKDKYSYIEFEEFPCDHSAIKQIDFDVKIDFGKLVSGCPAQKKNDENIINNASLIKNPLQDFNKEISALKNSLIKYFNKNILFYYEFKNSNNDKRLNNLLEINSNSIINTNDKISLKIATTKEDIYIESLSYIFFRLLEQKSDFINDNLMNNDSDQENRFFYILLPLYACYFFNNLDTAMWINRKDKIKENGILISNISKNLEKKLNDRDIEYDRIDTNFSDINNLVNPSYVSRRKNSETRSTKNFSNNINSNYISDYSHYIQGDNEASNDSSIIYIKNYNQVLFFNEFLNSYEESYFRIISPYPFANSLSLTNQFSIDVYRNEDNFNFKIKINGCIFQNYLKKILDLFQSISESFSFIIFHHYKTPAFHLVNNQLKHPIEHVTYENKKYLIRTKKQ